MKKILLFMVAILLAFGFVSCKQDVEVKTYTVTFDANGAQGDVPRTVQVKEGESINVPSCGSLSMKGYDFTGWNTKKDGSGRTYRESQSFKVDSDTTLYAQWSIHEYSISYELNGGSYPEGRSNPNTYTIETETFTLNSPEKNGYEFLGWTTSGNEEPNKNVSIGKGTTGDLSFTAVWRLAFSIRYDANGGEGYVGGTYKQKGESAEIATASEVSRKGYEFVCWNTASDGTGVVYKPGDSYNEDADIRLYAKWEVVKYNISYDLSGGAMPDGKSNPFEYTIESDTFILVNPKREGYVFEGWKVAGSSDETAEENLSIAKGSFGNKVFTAVWRSASKCTVTFDANGADGGIVPDALTVFEGESFIVPSRGSLSRTGYVFDCWNASPEGDDVDYIASQLVEVDRSITLYAAWKTSKLWYVYNSETDSYSVSGRDSYSTSIVIPSKYNGKPVTIIDGGAFRGCSNLSQISIPSSVTTIYSSAFEGCSSLSKITIPKSVTTIDYEIFSDCSSLETIEVETGNPVYHSEGNCLIETGSKKLVLGCKSSIIPEEITEIGDYAFMECTGLTDILIPSSVTDIGYGAFRGCSRLTELTIPSSVTSIRDSAFSECSGLTKITIPKGMLSIEKYAFYGCSRLTVEFEKGMTKIPDEALYGASGVISIIIPSTVTNIGIRSFVGCKGLTEITMPKSVNNIGESAFALCSNLAEITIPENVTNIGESVFSGCSGLTEIAIPSSVTSVGRQAFMNCSGLTKISIPKSVASIERFAFTGCSGLERIEVETGNPVYHSEGNCLIETGSKKLVLGCKSSIIPEEITEIGDYAFMECTGLTDILIPSSVTDIGYGAFRGCSRLTELTIPSSVTSIRDSAFSECSGLKKLSIPSSVTNIGNAAFNGCIGLTDIFYLGTKAQWGLISKDLTWDYDTGNYIIHCTDGDIAKN